MLVKPHCNVVLVGFKAILVGFKEISVSFKVILVGFKSSFSYLNLNFVQFKKAFFL